MKKLHVGNLSYAVNEDQLKALFETSGRKVVQVHMPRDRDSGSPRGFAFIEFESDDDAKAAAAALDGTKLQGRPLRVGESRQATGIEGRRASAKKRTRSGARSGPRKKGPLGKTTRGPEVMQRRGRAGPGGPSGPRGGSGSGGPLGGA